jgi:hypothetical protein
MPPAAPERGPKRLVDLAPPAGNGPEARLMDRFKPSATGETRLWAQNTRYVSSTG